MFSCILQNLYFDEFGFCQRSARTYNFGSCTSEGSEHTAAKTFTIKTALVFAIIDDSVTNSVDIPCQYPVKQNSHR
jgi:hypothetical protein